MRLPQSIIKVVASQRIGVWAYMVVGFSAEAKEAIYAQTVIDL